MAKKLKYPYEQWKDAQRESEHPQPPDEPMSDEEEEIDLVGLPEDEQTPKSEAPVNLAGRWCLMCFFCGHSRNLSTYNKLFYP